MFGAIACALLLFVGIYMKCLLFHYYVWNSVPVSSIVSKPAYFWLFHLPKISMSLLICSVIIVFANIYVAFVILLVIDLWIVANLFYYRSARTLIDGCSILMTGNMKGFWSSLATLAEAKDIILFLPSLFVIPFFCVNRHARFAVPVAITLFLSGMALHLFTMFMINKERNDSPKKCLNPFSKNVFSRIMTPSIMVYVNNFSVYHSLVFDAVEVIQHHVKQGRKESAEDIPHVDLINKLTHGADPMADTPRYSDKLLIVVVESLENWAIDPSVTPNICKLVDSDHCLYAPHLKSQIRSGISSDGQMIINTGLLPIVKGATCFEYPQNVFPGIAKCAKGRTICVDTCPPDVWNQKYMIKGYGYQESVVEASDDYTLFKKAKSCLDEGYQVVQVITMTSHMPFVEGAKFSDLSTDSKMPSTMRNYLKCINYTDAGMGELINLLITDPDYQDVSVLITGDHTIFRHDQRQRFKRYCAESGQTFSVEEDFCPMILFSNKIRQNRKVEEDRLQMDIYPTLCHLLGLDGEVWRGLGHSLFESIEDDKRVISEALAYELSDEIITNNLFNCRTR